MIDNFFITILTIVIVQSTLLFLYHFIINRNKKNNDVLDEKLKTIEAILKSTKHDKILSIDKIKDIELNSQEVYVFSKNMFRDVKNNGQFAKNSYNIGTFYPTVKKNLSKSNIQYTYFLKKDSHWKHFIHNFFQSYKDIDNLDTKVKFFMIPAEKYFFYDELYLYKYNNKYIAFEFLPSISDEVNKMLYYLELEEQQVDRLMDIKDQLTKTYNTNNLTSLLW